MKLQTVTRHLAPYRVYGRLSTTAGYGFAAAMAPREPFNAASWAEALGILGQDPGEDLTCVYCDAPATAWDQLYGLVRDEQPTGHGHVVGNLVPACGPCNTRKGSRPWREFVDELPEPARSSASEKLEALAGRFLAAGGSPVGSDPSSAAQRDELMVLAASIRSLLSCADQLVATP